MSIPSLFYSEDGGRLSPLAYIFLILFSIAIFIPGLVSIPPTDRDESSFAQASKQMIESHNYVDIRLQDKPRYKKPIGIYWLQTASVNLFNPHHLDEIWAYRIPSLVGATLAVMMTAVLGSLLFGPTAGLLAALMMAGSVLLNVEARLAKTDAVLLGSIMLSQYALAYVYIKRKKNAWIAFLFWTALGIGILVKGPLILLVLFSTLLWLRFSDKNLKWFKYLKPLFGLPFLFALVAPWFIAISLASHGTFIEQSAGHDLLAKLWEGQNRAILPPGVHFLAFPILFFPFSIFVLLALPDTWKAKAEPAVKFCLGWIVPTWIVFELSLTKLPHYVLPAYPALAMLAAKALIDGYPALKDPVWRWPIALAVGLWLMIGTGFSFLLILLPYIIDHAWSPLSFVIGLFLISLQAAALFQLFKRDTRSVIILACASLIFMPFTFGTLLPTLEPFWISRQVMKVANTVKPCEVTQIASASYGEPSLVFLAGTGTKIFPAGSLVASDMIRNPCDMGLIDAKHEQDFLSAFPDKNIQPIAAGKIGGLNLGHGRTTDMTLYLLYNPSK